MRWMLRSEKVHHMGVVRLTSSTFTFSRHTHVLKGGNLPEHILSHPRPHQKAHAVPFIQCQIALYPVVSRSNTSNEVYHVQGFVRVIVTSDTTTRAPDTIP